MTLGKKASAKEADCTHYKFILFVAGQESNSALARQNLQCLCQDHLPGRHTIEIIDVFLNLDAAFKHNILITPTLIKVAPDPPATVFGNLSSVQTVMASLRI
ncbi:MAG: circadian clock KaiB family protein [Desulfatibacillaceae bacterium]|nr:circadian clock KaiB family protein [Desulfatibacillaceae bacterium]